MSRAAATTGISITPKAAADRFSSAPRARAGIRRKDKEAVSLTAGTVITIPAEVKHWHGAKKDSWFSHIAVEVPGEETSNEWCEPVNDEAYNKLEGKSDDAKN